MPCSQREFIFQNLVHSHTKGFEEAGLRTHGGGYSWIVDKIREFVGRWFGIPESQNLGIFGGGEGFVRWRWAAADSRSKWGAALGPTLEPARQNDKGRISPLVWSPPKNKPEEQLHSHEGANCSAVLPVLFIFC